MYIQEPRNGKLDFFVTFNDQEELCYKEVRVLEISCSSNLEVTFGIRAMQKLEVLEITCSSFPDVTFGPGAIPDLELLQVKGPGDENAQRELQGRLAELRKKPVLKVLSS